MKKKKVKAVAKVALAGPVRGKERSQIDVQIGQKIRIRRTELSISQAELGDAAGVSFQQIQKYEKGANRVSGSKIVQLANALQVTPDYFFEGAGTKQTIAESSYNEFMTTMEGPMLIKAMVAIHNPDLRRAVVTLARNLAEIEE